MSWKQEVIRAIGEVNGWEPCKCSHAFERDCSLIGCTPAMMKAAHILASYIKVEDIKATKEKVIESV